MHIFLTGEIQVGKSTLIKRFLETSGALADGYSTVWFPPGTRRSELHILPYGTAAEDNGGEKTRVAQFSGDSITVFDEVFNTVGAGLLKSAGRCDYIVLDELGFMESRAEAFQQAVFELLGGEVPVIGVIKPRSTPFLDSIRAHPRTALYEVSPDNRDEALRQMLLHSGY